MFGPPMPRRRPLRIGGPEIGFLVFSCPPRRSNAPPRRTSPLRRSKDPPRRSEPLGLGVEKLRLGVPTNSVFGSSFPLSLTIVHWINEDPNK